MVISSVLCRNRYLLVCLLLLGLGGRSPQSLLAAEVLVADELDKPRAIYEAVVNSAADGEIMPDDALTLREVLTLINGDLLFTDLSTAEQQQVQVMTTGDRYSIRFALPAGQTHIQLSSLLPPLRQSKVTIDGFASEEMTLEDATPGISLSPVVGTLIPRGLTISADDVTIQGLSIYGFNQNPTDLVANTISADIWVGQAQFLPHPNDLITLPENYEQGIPQNTVIRDNWLGLKPDGTPGDYQSDFGVWLHQATGFVVEHNRIYDHGSNGIVTGAEATQGMIADNQIVRNGLTGLADGIRLEGNVAGTTIQRNLICENGGGGIYLYRTQGATTIADNQIQDNGDRVARAAIFLMGSDHLVQDNVIRDQNGAGVAIAAYPASHRNQIVGNVFAGLQGLSIDLIAQNNVGIQETQVADGVNPPRNSPNRRKETANGAINAPRFLSPQFYPINGVVYLDGIADPGAEIILYQVEEAGATHGTLNKIVTQTMADDKGNFSFSFNEFTPGTVYSAIAYLPDYGTSEPAANTTIQLLATPIESMPAESTLEENLSTSGASPLIETSVPKVDCRSTNATNPTTDAKIESTESMELGE